LFIGKSKNPLCFRNLNKKALPVVYQNQTNAWVNRDIFKYWFFNCFFPQTKQRLRELGHKKEPFYSLTIVMPIQVRTNLGQLMAK